MIYLVLFIVSTIIVSFYTFFEMAYLLSAKTEPGKDKGMSGFLKRPEEVIITVLVGTNLWAIAASIFFRRFMGGGEAGGLIEGGLIVTIILFVFSEMLPKNIATYMYREFFPFVAPFVWWTYIVFSPLVRGVESITRKFYGKSKKVEDTKERDVIAYMAEIRKQLSGGDIESYMDVIEETVRFLASPVIDYAIGLKEINFIDIENPDYTTAQKKNFSIVYSGKIDNVIGILKGKYLYPLRKGYLKLDEVLEEPLFVHESQKIKKVLDILWESGKKEAIVVDEHGNIKGAFSVCSLRNIILNISRRHFITLWGTDSVERLARLCGGVNTMDMQKSLHEFLVDRLGEDIKVGSTVYLERCRLTIISLKGGVVERVIVETRGGENGG